MCTVYTNTTAERWEEFDIGSGSNSHTMTLYNEHRIYSDAIIFLFRK